MASWESHLSSGLNPSPTEGGLKVKKLRPLWQTTFQVLLLQVDSRPHISSWPVGWVAPALAPGSLAFRSHVLLEIPPLQNGWTL